MLPDSNTDAVLIALDSASGACVWIGEAGKGVAQDLSAMLALAAEASASEVHVHLLAGNREARLAAIRDLDGRH